MSVIEYLKNTEFEYMSDNLEKYFSTINKDEKIYPGDIKKEFGYTLKDIYNALTMLENKYVKTVMEIFCPDCNSSINTYKTFNALPTTAKCNNCGKNHKFANYINSTIVIFFKL